MVEACDGGSLCCLEHAGSADQGPGGGKRRRRALGGGEVDGGKSTNASDGEGPLAHVDVPFDTRHFLVLIRPGFPFLRHSFKQKMDILMNE